MANTSTNPVLAVSMSDDGDDGELATNEEWDGDLDSLDENDGWDQLEDDAAASESAPERPPQAATPQTPPEAAAAEVTHHPQFRRGRDRSAFSGRPADGPPPPKHAHPGAGAVESHRRRALSGAVTLCWLGAAAAHVQRRSGSFRYVTRMRAVSVGPPKVGD